MAPELNPETVDMARHLTLALYTRFNAIKEDFDASEGVDPNVVAMLAFGSATLTFAKRLGVNPISALMAAEQTLGSNAMPGTTIH